MPLYRLGRDFVENNGVLHKRGDTFDFPEGVKPPSTAILVEELPPVEEPQLDLLDKKAGVKK
jgi:hypothetical protein